MLLYSCFLLFCFVCLLISSILFYVHRLYSKTNTSMYTDLRLVQKINAIWIPCKFDISVSSLSLSDNLWEVIYCTMQVPSESFKPMRLYLWMVPRWVLDLQNILFLSVFDLSGYSGFKEFKGRHTVLFMTCLKRFLSCDLWSNKFSWFMPNWVLKNYWRYIIYL